MCAMEHRWIASNAKGKPDNIFGKCSRACTHFVPFRRSELNFSALVAIVCISLLCQPLLSLAVGWIQESWAFYSNSVLLGHFICTNDTCFNCMRHFLHVFVSFCCQKVKQSKKKCSAAAFSNGIPCSMNYKSWDTQRIGYYDYITCIELVLHLFMFVLSICVSSVATLLCQHWRG